MEQSFYEWIAFAEWIGLKSELFTVWNILRLSNTVTSFDDELHEWFGGKRDANFQVELLFVTHRQ